ncbi:MULTISPECIES: DUF2306 domain-containing protein [unclassified Paenibacillus]|uniref:DUF2306 domain-containing protein n=1 Tax=unclassified Paenibacillus TaxID=185978 RepID=UPI00070FD320|nr:MULTISPECIES: DUF2306 domain-containing protein [unclassified Paenibacillus]KQX66365.1 hypothetical protein ASD40_28135 [Paenibacillus sp. Root444D2]KRE40948.1 hypothetical protein ASG85_34280 [Paenibacillus sp. Soil724D2]
MSKKLGIFFVMIIIGVAIAAVFPYVSLNPADSRVKLNTAFSLHYTVLVLHIGFAFIALVSGLFQFHKRFRTKYPAWHRALGRVYVVSVMLGGFLGLVMTLYIESFTKAMAFLALSLLWLFTTWKGFRYAVQRQFDEHRVWMIRSYAITLVATSARLIVPICILLYIAMQGFHLPSGGREQMVADILEINIWIGLLINLIGVEWFLLKPRKGK